MKTEPRWSRRAIDDLRNFDKKVVDRITKKVDWFCQQAKPLMFAKSLEGKFEDVYRFRVGEYRVLFEVLNGKVCILMILRVKHRKDVYE